MVTITVSEYFEEGGADEYATLLVESDAIGPDCTEVPADVRPKTQWITVVPAEDGSLSVRIAASAVRSPGVRQELEDLIGFLTEKEDALRRSGQSVRENNRVLDHLVISLTGEGTGESMGENTGKNTEESGGERSGESADGEGKGDGGDGPDLPADDDASVVSRLMNSEAEIPQGHKWYDTAIARNPEDAMAWNAKGEALAATGQTTEARKCFARALEIDPEYRDARYNLNHVKGMERIG